MVKILGKTTPKFSPEIGSKLPYIYPTTCMDDVYFESSL